MSNKIFFKKQYGLMISIVSIDALNFMTNLIYHKLDKSELIADIS